jgi:hypothetical protein
MTEHAFTIADTSTAAAEACPRRSTLARRDLNTPASSGLEISTLAVAKRWAESGRKIGTRASATADRVERLAGFGGARAIAWPAAALLAPKAHVRTAGARHVVWTPNAER